MNFFWVHLKKEFLLSQRHRETFTSLLFFCFLVVLIFDFGFAADKRGNSLVVPLVWLATLFGGLMRLNRTFEPEAEGHVADVLRTFAGAATSVFVSKWLVNLIYVVILEILSFALVVLFFNVADPLMFLAQAGVPFLLGAVGVSAVGTTFSAFLIGHRRKDLVLPIIVFPVLVPLVLSVMNCVEFSASGMDIFLNLAWLKLTAVFVLVTVTLSVLVFESVWKA